MGHFLLEQVGGIGIHKKKLNDHKKSQFKTLWQGVNKTNPY